MVLSFRDLEQSIGFKLVKSSSNSQRSFLSGIKTTTNKTFFDVPKHRAGTAFDQVARFILSTDIIVNDRLSGLSFRNTVEDASGTIAVDREKPSKMAIFIVKGQVLIAEDEWDDFEVGLTSDFLEFKGAHHIVHSVDTFRSDNIPLFVNLVRVGRLLPLKIDSFELGLQYYRTKHTTFLGYTPTPYRTLHMRYIHPFLEATETIDSPLFGKFGPKQN